MRWRTVLTQRPSMKKRMRCSSHSIGVVVEVGQVALDADLLEVEREPRVALRLHSDADPAARVVEFAPEDLGDADLAAVFGALLEADRPEGDHRIGMPDRPHPHLDHSEVRQPEPPLGLLFAHDEPVAESVLPDRAARRARRTARSAGAIRAPRRRTPADHGGVSASMRSVRPPVCRGRNGQRMPRATTSAACSTATIATRPARPDRTVRRGRACALKDRAAMHRARRVSRHPAFRRRPFSCPPPTRTPLRAPACRERTIPLGRDLRFPCVHRPMEFARACGSPTVLVTPPPTER